MIKLKMLLLLSIIILKSDLQAQIKNAKTETVMVYGNCDMCKAKIETASTQKKISKGVWNVDTKMLVLTYDTLKTDASKLLKKVALAGYDSKQYLAPDNVYNKLPSCCKYDRPNKKGIEKSTTVANAVNANASSKMNILADVYEAYFGLKDALVKDDGVTASNRAKELFKAIDNVPMNKMATDAHTVWMKYEKKLSYDAEHIKGVTDTEHQREHFISLSKNMYEVMKIFKMDIPVYYDFCPMADNGKGANWLSLQQPINNPYMGKSMPTCGKVQETIK